MGDDSDSDSDDWYYDSSDEVSDAIAEISAAIYHEYYAENYGDIELSTESDDESDTSVSPEFDTPQPPAAKRKECKRYPPLRGAHGVGSDCNAQNQNLGDKEQDDGKDDEKENEDDDELIWCQSTKLRLLALTAAGAGWTGADPPAMGYSE
ncbi:hypothetical protein BJY01DRAFT_249534 [Aspergillus pseudoustus]|uniref:Uncharacterized protein n=1 Tax=Aspergillus pseudoustus TaxID=1810923 RepID=A0ABR4JN36_9EURO